jgi:hypothetical protein
MATELITSTPKGTVLYEARLFRRKGALYLYLKSPLLEEHFRAVASEPVNTYSEWTAVDPDTLHVLTQRQKIYNVHSLACQWPYGSGGPLGRADTSVTSPNLAVFVREGLADGICYRLDEVMISSDKASSYLSALRDSMRKYFECNLSRLDLTMTVTTLREVV